MTVRDQPPVKLDAQAICDLAAVAHRHWCRVMEAQGWVVGRPFDPDAKTHDALVPFEKLSAQDQRHARIGIEALELERALLSAIDYQRGPDREFLAEEMWPGRRVALTDTARTDGRAPVTGGIDSWTTDRHGILDLIRVRWDDGSVSEHAACERVLIRLPRDP